MLIVQKIASETIKTFIWHLCFLLTVSGDGIFHFCSCLRSLRTGKETTLLGSRSFNRQSFHRIRVNHTPRFFKVQRCWFTTRFIHWSLFSLYRGSFMSTFQKTLLRCFTHIFTSQVESEVCFAIRCMPVKRSVPSSCFTLSQFFTTGITSKFL